MVINSDTQILRIDRTVSVAPMMGCTDRHARFFMRLISPDVLLYSEMITTAALLHGDAANLLAYDHAELPLALQLGGSDPAELAQCARLGELAGYSEINLNVGCPSSRVSAGGFGACLMREPQLVASCVAAMRSVVKIPVTVKCRIGVDELDSYAYLQDFTGLVHAAGCEIFIIHARKAWLSGLSPKQNRHVPPLCYERVQQIKQDFPSLTIILNGGICTVDEVASHLQIVDGVMIGREAYARPWLLAEIAEKIFCKKNMPARAEIMNAALPYIEQQLKNGVKLHSMTRHLLGFFQGQKGARNFRRHLSENACKPLAGCEVIVAALALVDSEY